MKHDACVSTDGVLRQTRGLSRRSFLKTAGLVAGGTALMGSASLQAMADEPAAEAVASVEEKVCRGVCRPNCFGYCHLNVHVRDGKVVKTSRAPYNDEKFSRICHRGLSHVQRIYDPDRLQYPLRRVEGTARGAGEWERISWDEAIDELAKHIKEDQEKYGPQALSLYSGTSSVQAFSYYMYQRLWALLKPTSISYAVDMGTLYGTKRMTGPMSNLWEGNDAADMVNAKTIVFWASNVTDSQIQTWHFVKEAKQNGTKVVVVDPTYTYAASKADWWLPIRPGADMPLYMGIMNYVVEHDKIDREYLLANTVAPFLVRSDNGMFLRASDLGIEPVKTGQTNPTTGEEIILDDYITIQKGKTEGAATAKAPELVAEYDFKGVKCRTAYSLLLDEIAKFPLDKVSELTEISVEDIERLAEICADTPVFHYVGYGTQARYNGHHATHAGLTMAALTGNLGKPGANYGNCWYMYFYANSAFASPNGEVNTTPGIVINDFPDIVESGQFAGQDFPIKDLYVYYGNPLNCAMDTNRLLEAFDKLDFICVADSVMTDTARYADLVLPVAQWFEQTDVTFAGQTICLSYNEKAIDPLYESKTDPEIVKMLADKLGYGDLFQIDVEDGLTELFSGPLNEMFGISYERIKAEGDVRFVMDAPHVAWAGGAAAGAFSTPSGRLEFYLENPMPYGAYLKQATPEQVEFERLPRWVEPREAWPTTEAAKKYPLFLMSERPRYRVHSQWSFVKALRELDPEPFVKINPADAEARGIKDNDYVECYNDHGSCVVRAVFSNAIRPGTLVYPKGWQMSQFKEGSWSRLISKEYHPFLANALFMDVACEIRTWNEGR